ncbi:YesN/AraC family two-component response regulator [Chryseobacterium vietnamense]|uniref:helix-turn-helix domain-containing protein n=1 Tax=Chryseobacterium vietnamense TaxID=866785 RepID=UPI00286438BF|nr:helix-turn-helix transcriptional regulator [Chryseobacterium vietnamense]MDR6485684.1 YesN/AraC family two-component response regulator [Chryseobacterium vietnamense]
MTKKILFCLYLLFSFADEQLNHKSQIDAEIENAKKLYENEFNKIMELSKKVNQFSEKRIRLYTQLNNIANTKNKVLNAPLKYIMVEHGEKYPHLIVFVPSVVIIFLLNNWAWKNNQKKQNKRDEITIKQSKEETPVTEFKPILLHANNKKADNTISISEATTISLLSKLSRFEKSEKFLKKDLTLTTLSNSLNTNPRYLSEIIKQHKGKNFNNYLNGLRIQYITNKLTDTPVFREYKISYLAEACGFSSREVFSVVFKKEMGVTPSHFISKLKKM